RVGRRRRKKETAKKRGVGPSSIRVLCVVLEGIGLALALNFTTTVTSSPRTNSVISVMTTSSQSWKLVMLSITGEADPCSLYSHGLGCPSAEHAAPAVARATRAA